MCYYCRYLTHVNSSSSLSSQNIYDDNQYIPYDTKHRHTQSCNITMSLCLVTLTSFFVILNITLVLSQSPQIQRQQISNKILQENSRGKIYFIFTLVHFVSNPTNKLLNLC